MIRLVLNLTPIAAFLSLFIAGTAFAFPDPPTGVAASDGALNTITINWTAPAAGDAPVSYRLYRSNSNVACQGAPFVAVAHPTATFTDASFLNTNVWYYSIRSVNASSQESNCSSTDSGWAIGLPPPGVASPVVASDTFLDRIVVTWPLPANSQPITSMRLYRTDDQGFKFCDGTLIESSLPAGTTTYTDTSATVGVPYYYALKMVGPTGIGNCSLVPDDGRILLPPPPNPPTNVAATDGTFPHKVKITWVPPSGGGTVTNIKLHRSTIQTTGCNSLHMDNIPANGTVLDDEISVVPGTQYYYWMQAIGPDGTSDCSIMDPGHAQISPPENISATDGTFPDKVEVVWNPPTLGGNITGYDLYRDSTCSSAAIASGLTSTNYSDTNVTPGVVYTYSAITKSPTGDSICSVLDTGYTQIAAPTIVTASDGTFPDQVEIDWVSPPSPQPVTSFTIFRDTQQTSCAVLLQSGVGAGVTSFTDLTAVPGTIYYYSIKTEAASGASTCSNIDPGHAITECSDGLDNDGDGLADFPNDPGCNAASDTSERDPAHICDDGLDNDGDGITDFKPGGQGDPGCVEPTDVSEDDSDTALESPTYVKFNTFNGQEMFAELANQGSNEKRVKLTLFNLSGEEMITRQVIVPAKSQLDIGINSLIKLACDVLNSGCDGFEDLSATRGAPNGLGRADGVVDTYGLIRLEFDDTDLNQRLMGRVSFYRPNVDGSFSFAFGRELRNAISGVPSFVSTNTHDPRGLGNLIPNWAEVINLGERQDDGSIDNVPNTFTVNVYKQDGQLKEKRVVSIPARGELDLHGGHEYTDSNGVVLESVYSIEVIPHNSRAEYLLSAARYSSNSAPGIDPETYNYALVIPGETGTSETMFAPIGNTIEGVPGLNTSVLVTNWVETTCVSHTGCSVTVLYRDSQGSVVANQTELYPPMAQYHYHAGVILPSLTTGSVEIQVNKGKILGQSMSYVHEGNELQTGFNSVARTRGRAEQVGTINTFLGMTDALVLFSSTNDGVNATLEVNDFNGVTSSASVSLSNGGSSILGIDGSTGLLNVPSDTVGALLLSTGKEGVAMAEVRRVRLDAKGRVDFVMTTTVR